jgi:hypothetical protein
MSSFTKSKKCGVLALPPFGASGALKSERPFSTFFDGANRKCSFLEFENNFFTR